MNKYILIVIAAAALAGVGAYAQSTGTFKDSRDGKTYKTVKMGGKTWMAENLNYAAEESACGDDNDANCAKYGRMYNWETAQKACPADYHLPSDNEWEALVNYAGGYEKAGKKLKSKAGWDENGNGTDDFGWSALPGGYGYSDGSVDYAGGSGRWWSASVYGADDAWIRIMHYNNDYVDRGTFFKSGLVSVRCVQN
jgi:uncharacterized protein (TIGR02145 family)